MRWMVRAAALLAVLALGACGKDAPKDAVGAVQGFLAAAKAGDAKTFEAGLDRNAVRADLRRQLVSVARQNSVDVDGGPSDLALDRMISPEAVARVDADADGLKSLSGDLVCLHDRTAAHACLLTFARQKKARRRPAGWRLVGMQAPDPTVQIGIDLAS